MLKKGKVFGILLGDTRSERHYIPITTYALLLALDVGFVLKEEVIKVQHKMKTTREVWNKKKERDFLLIEHEKLFILEKLPETKSFKYSKNSLFLSSNFKGLCYDTYIRAKEFCYPAVTITDLFLIKHPYLRGMD